MSDLLDQSYLTETFDIERFFDLRVEAADEWAKRTPHPRTFERRLEVDRPISVTFTSDWHVGSPGTRHRLLRDDMLRIAEHPHQYVEIGGDWGDNYVVPALMRVGMSSTFAAGDEQAQIILYIVKPLFDAEKVLSVRAGNHDNWLKSVANLDPRYSLFGHVPHLCSLDGSVMVLHVGDQTYRIFRRHRPRFHSVFNPAHSVVAEYQRNPFEFDIGIIEHEHMSHGADFDGKMREDGSTTRLAIRTGTYKLADDFADARGYYYSNSTQQTVILWPDKFQMLRVRGLDLATDLLDRL